MYYRKQWERTLTFPFPSSVADYIKQRIFSVFDKKKTSCIFFLWTHTTVNMKKIRVQSIIIMNTLVPIRVSHS